MDEVIKNVLIEGLRGDGSGGETIKGDLTTEQTVDGINKLLGRYRTVAYVPNYPHGHTFKFSSPIDESDL
jgi:hypothetical protein